MIIPTRVQLIYLMIFLYFLIRNVRFTLDVLQIIVKSVVFGGILQK